MCNVKQEDLIDGKEYIVTFNNGRDCVSAMWLEEYQIFNFLVGSLSYTDVSKIE